MSRSVLEEWRSGGAGSAVRVFGYWPKDQGFKPQQDQVAPIGSLSKGHLIYCFDNGGRKCCPKSGTW